MAVVNGSRTRPEIGHEDCARSHRLLARVFHEVLSETDSAPLMELIADSLAELVPYNSLILYRADERRRELIPVLARDRWAEEILRERTFFGEGITGWAVENREPVRVNQAHLDPRRVTIAGTTEDEPEALLSVPLIAKGSIKGALNLYRFGATATFSDEDLELAKLFGDTAALGLDNAEIHAVLKHQAKSDSLTGLYNHRYFHDRVHAELARAIRTGDSVAVVMLDIDDFKRVNDVYGHSQGDDILETLAQQLVAGARASDVVCRLGGEEFGVIMPSATAEDGRAFADRFQAIPSTFDDVGGVTFSIGVAEGPAQASHAKSLAAYAENAMMTAKARGKDNVVVFGDTIVERPDAPSGQRDARSISHLKLLRRLSGKLNRLNTVQEFGSAISDELRTMIDYDTCRIYVREAEELLPISLAGDIGVFGNNDPGLLRCKVGEGVAGKAAQDLTSLLVTNSLECSYAVTIPGSSDIEESLIAVPLVYGQRCVGVIVLSKLGREQFDSDEMRLLEVLAGHASVALENARLYEAQKRQAEHAKALLEFSRTLASADDQEEIATFAAQMSAELLDISMASVWLQEAGSDHLHPIALSGQPDEARGRVSGVHFGADFLQRNLHRPDPFVMNGGDFPPDTGLREEGTQRSWAVAPFGLDKGRVGIIVCGAPVVGKHRFSSPEMELLAGIAHQTRLAITKIGMFEDLEETFLSTIESLASTLEAKDEGTSSHARSLKDKATALGERVGLMGPDLKRLEIAALFHDIGKIGIPTDILLKPGRLTKDERRVIETHPEIGERILRPIERLQDVAWIVRNCHEHYDGSGYPDGRVGRAIPFEARIILICDAFDAMSSDRPYRKRLPPAEVRKRLREAAGTQFDPELVPVFLDLLLTEPAPPVAG